MDKIYWIIFSSQNSNIGYQNCWCDASLTKDLVAKSFFFRFFYFHLRRSFGDDFQLFLRLKWKNIFLVRNPKNWSNYFCNRQAYKMIIVLKSKLNYLNVLYFNLDSSLIWRNNWADLLRRLFHDFFYKIGSWLKAGLDIKLVSFSEEKYCFLMLDFFL